MKLSELFKNFQAEIIGDDVEIDSICFQEEGAKRGSVYFCLNNSDYAENQIRTAVFNGASAVVCEEDIDTRVTHVKVKSCRKALSVASSNFYGFSKDIKIVGVVGTNGKTSTCNILEQILTASGKKVGTICTQQARLGDLIIKTDMTTPDPPQLFEIISKMHALGAEYIVMEVSAHAIFFHKCYAIKFKYLIFTNCSQDHLDFFRDYDRYKEVKQSIFDSENCEIAVINSDDECGIEILQKMPTIAYGINNPAEVFAINIKEGTASVEFVMNAFDDIQKIKLKTIGLFNVYNFLGAVSVALKEGVNSQIIVDCAKSLKPILGRCEFLGKYNGGMIYLDYAHTPQGLKNLLNSFKNVCKGNLICLFGCGGNRDKDKRHIMGEIAGKNADFIVITSDNPRFEEPYQIIDQIEMGVRAFSRKYITIQNRKTAIGYAISKLGKNDILLLAGKGSEEYQEIMGTKHRFSDKETVAEILNKLGKNV